MIRKAVLTAIILAILACAPSGGVDLIPRVECRVELTVYCEIACREAGAEATGYAEFIPSHRFQCICMPNESGKLNGIGF